MLELLCEKYTKLSNEDIEILKTKEESLAVLSEFLSVDVFIDVQTEDPDIALVVGQAMPKNTIYGRSVVGEFAKSRNEPAVIRTIQTRLPSKKYKAITQDGKNVIQDVIPILNKNQKLIGVLIAEAIENEENSQDKRIFNENAMKFIENVSDSSERIIDYLEEGVVVFNEKGSVVFANNPAKKIFSKIGIKKHLIGEEFDNIVLNEVRFCNIANNIETDLEVSKEITIMNRILKISYLTSSETNGIFNVYLIIQDITKERENEKELMVKSVAIKEIHHRVKNNLQTIASLLRIQKRRVKDLETKHILDESINRVLSIAVTHELLSQNGFENLKIKTIVQLMCTNFSRNCIDKSDKIMFNVFGDDFYINSDKATSIALVINEILQNTIDHAFKKDQTKEIKITIKEDALYSTIIIADNGVGMDNSRSLKEGLGFSIITAIIKGKLNGDMNIESEVNKGTTFKFIFKNN